jgi:hypothetical protein
MFPGNRFILLCMANYLSPAGAFKKRLILEKRIDALTGALKRSESLVRLESAAERVREAQLSVLRCLEDEITPRRVEGDQHERELANLHRRRERWLQTAVAEIIRHYATERSRSGHGLIEPPSA